MPPSIQFPDTIIADLIASGAYMFIGPHGDGTGSTSVAVVDLEDIIDRDTLEPVNNFLYMGASREGQGSNYEQNVTTTELRVDQDTEVVFENIAETVRQIQFQWAQLDPAKLAILEESTVAGGTGGGGALAAGDLWSVEGGVLTFRSPYRVALLGRREPGFGRDITNSAGKVRGEIVGVCLQNAKISAGANQFELQRGQLANMSPQFKGYPDATAGNTVVWVGEHGPETLTGS